MTRKSSNRPPAGIPLGEIYHVLFRHKWLIAIGSACGIIAYFVLPLVWRLPYQSEAKLDIRYVRENKSTSQIGSDNGIKSPDERGENVINTEQEILNSLDLAQSVVTNIGAEKILAKLGGGSNPNAATAYIHGNLTTDVPKRSNVIRIIFKHPDPEIAHSVLTSLIHEYIEMHAKIHMTGGLFDDILFLTEETKQIRSSLAGKESDLKKAKDDAGVISVEESKKSIIEQASKISQAIFETETELAERRAAVGEMNTLLPGAASNNSTNTTNKVVALSDKVAEYRRLRNHLEILEKREAGYLLQFTPEAEWVKEVRQQIADEEKRKEELEAENPGLLNVALAPLPSAAATTDPRAGIAAEKARIMALESRLDTLTNRLEQIRTNTQRILDAEGHIAILQREKEMEEERYRHFTASLEQSRLEEKLGSEHVSNISTIQNPSAPFQDPTKLRKARMMSLVGGILGSLALAFLIEFQLDRSLKRPVELESRLGLPLFISIPLLKRNGKQRLLNGGTKKAITNGDHDQSEPAGQQIESPLPVVNGKNGTIAPWDSRHSLRPFFETLRDRLINYFEVNNLTHKPKLVAVAGCGDGSGVTTIASGLAAALSETGDGNVLLVDMNQEQGAAHHFYHGNLNCGLDDALEMDKRGNALVQENLYVVAESTNLDKLPRVLPKRFTNLLPKLKASDYDYIIFDMPAINQTSVTPRLAKFMDMVLMVVESEKTDRDVARNASALLVESRANVGLVLNKSRNYVPRRIQQQF